jgi:pimeloyl-ACP methyl ester carboxylesterase
LALLLIGEGAPPIARSYPFERYVLVSSPNRFSSIVDEFAQDLGLRPEAARVFDRHIERIAHRPIETFTAANLLRAIGRPALVMHSRDDKEVAFQNAGEIVAAWPEAELMAFDGLGHRNILFASPVIRAAISYLTRS